MTSTSMPSSAPNAASDSCRLRHPPGSEVNRTVAGFQRQFDLVAIRER